MAGYAPAELFLAECTTKLQCTRVFHTFRECTLLKNRIRISIDIVDDRAMPADFPHRSKVRAVADNGPIAQAGDAGYGRLAVKNDFQTLLTKLRDRWNRLSLAFQYGLAGSVVVVCAMLAIGLWVTRVIEDGLKDNAAAATALYVDSIIAPILPELRGNADKSLDRGVLQALDETLSAGALGARLQSFKIWKTDGSILYAGERSLIGKRFPITDALAAAVQGRVVAELDQLSDEESAVERASGLPLLEIYSPIREPWSGEVVAVLEFYEVANDIEARLATARRESWLVVAAVALATVGLLFGIVFRGSRTIQRQQQSLTARVQELSQLSTQNSRLRERIQRASSRAAAFNERYLRRIGADLHDGPAQLVAFAALRLEGKALTDAATPQPVRDKEVAAIRNEPR